MIFCYDELLWLAAMIHATLCFVFRDEPDPSILLGFKKRGFGQAKYDGFGGKILDSETLTQAVLRELNEESGLSADPSDLIPLGIITFIFPDKPAWSQVVHLFVVHKWHGTPTESDEMRPEWFPLSNLPLHKMWDDAQYWMQHVLLHHPINATFILNDDNETVKDYSIQLL
jgi:8-oxo-dGTP diphosphatase